MTKDFRWADSHRADRLKSLDRGPALAVLDGVEQNRRQVLRTEGTEHSARRAFFSLR
jgi:hypothetical protein